MRKLDAMRLSERGGQYVSVRRCASTLRAAVTHGAGFLGIP